MKINEKIKTPDEKTSTMLSVHLEFLFNVYDGKRQSLYQGSLHFLK